MRQIDRHDGFDRTRSRSHYGHSVRQIDGFIDTVGNEDHCFLGLHPDALQLFLQDHSCLRIDRCKRLIHQKNLRIDREHAR